MTDSPNLLHRKNTHDKIHFNLRRSSEFQASPFSYEESDARSNYPNLQPQLQERKIFGFQIYVDNDILNDFGVIQEWFKQVAATHKVEHIRFNAQLTIPDLKGRNIQIYDVEMQKKYQCAKAMLSDIYQAFKKFKKEAFSVIIFVPEGMVSLLIGAKGHQINKIMRQSHTTIVVNQPINRMTYRTAKIQGYHSDIAKACRIIYEMLQQKSSIAYSIEKQPSQLDYTKSKIKSKFIFPDQLLSFLQKRKKKLLVKIEEETKCSIKFQSQKDNRLLKKQQSVCIMNGRLQDVQAMVVMIINISHDFLSEDKRNIDYTLKMLIPANYVTKLIGQKGYMIRDIIERSGGAQIKILSDKQEKDRQCIISINGSKQNKIDAACFIMEQIQCFKNGGPILQSGKSINQNLAQQFKNSLPPRDDQTKIQGKQSGQNPLSEQIVSQKNQKVKDYIQEEHSEQEGLIQPEEEQKRNDEKEREERQRIEREKRAAIERDLERINPLKKDKQHSRKSRSKSASNSRSRSRETKQKKKSKKLEFTRKPRSQSESVQYKHDKEHLQVKMIVPKKLGQDHKELKYIESLCKSSVQVLGERIQSGDVVIAIRGSMKDNSRCIQLLQKRLLRYKTSSASSVG